MAEPIRVATVIKRLHIGGDQVRVLTFARHLDRTRFEHVVLVVQPVDAERDERMGPILQRYRDEGVEVVTLGFEVHSFSNAGVDRPRTHLSVLRDLATSVRMLARLARTLRERRIDVVDARLELGTVFGLLAAGLARVPLVVSTGYSPTFWRKPVLWVLGQVSFAFLDAFITDAQATLDDYDRWRISKRARLALVRNGVETVCAPSTRAALRAALDVPADGFVVGQIGRLMPHKNHELFMQVARRVLDAAPSAAFVLCGYAEDPAYRARLERTIAQLGLSDRFRIICQAGPMCDVFGALDVLVHLSAFDSSPLVVHEAMSAAIPCVVTPVGGMAELVTDGDTGLFVPTGDADAAAAAVLRLRRDPALGERLGRAGREHHLANHRAELLARGHERLFEELLAAKSPGRELPGRNVPSAAVGK